MKNLFKVLPPFAPDYSGVCSVLFSLKGLVVVHDAGGCTGNITGYDEPRWYGSNAAILSSGLREIEAVVGDDDLIIKKITEAAAGLKREFVALMGSPAPAVIGTDLEALARIIEKKTGLPVLSFNTTGMYYYDRGASETYKKIAQRFVKPYAGEKLPIVNVLGATPLDIGQYKRVAGISSILEECGFQKVMVWGQNAGLDEIKMASKAVLNVVVAYSGLQAARYLKAEFATPYLAGIPIGNTGVRKLTYEAGLLLNKQYDMGYKPVTRYRTDINRCLIIGEQVRSNSLRQFIRSDYGIPDIDVVSFFSMDEELQEENDRFLEEEDDLTFLSQERDYGLIIGDPLYEALLADKPGQFYLSFPHVAVSSRLYWDNEPEYVGEKAGTVFEQLLSRYKIIHGSKRAIN